MLNVTRAVCGASLVALMLGLAVFNVQQWAAEGFIILAVIAACSELIGFAMAVMVERNWGRRWLASAVCLLILVICAGFNVIGAERAWDAAMSRHMEGARIEAQAALDATRAEARQKLADAVRRVREYDGLLPGPDVMRARQAGMQQAWEQATATARADAIAAQRDLDRLPVVAEVASPFAAWQVQLGFALAELIKCLGLWAIGAGQQRSTVERDETAPETDAVIVSFPAVPTAERVKAMRADGASFGEIARATGVPKTTAWRMVNG